MTEQAVKLVSQDYHDTEVVQEAFRPWYSIAAVMIGYAISFSIPLVGAAMGSSAANVSEGMIAILIGCLIMGIVGSVTAVIATRTRLTFGLVLRQAFGKHGQWLFGIAIAMLGLSVWVFGGNLCAETIRGSFGINFYIAFPIVGILFTTTAYIGFKALRILSHYFVPVILICMAIIGVVAVNSVGGLAGLEAISAQAPIPFTNLVTLATSAFVMGYASFSFDILRFAKNAKEGIIAVWCSIGGLIIAILMGFIVGRIEGVGVLGVALVGKYLLGALSGVLLILLISWSTLDNTMFSASLTLAPVFKINKTKMIIILGTIGIVLGLGRILNQFTPFIMKFGIFAPALAGVIWVEFFYAAKGKWAKIGDVVAKDKGKGIDINIYALIAFVVASLVSNYASNVAFVIPPPIVSIVTAVIVHLILINITRNQSMGKKQIAS